MWWIKNHVRITPFSAFVAYTCLLFLSAIRHRPLEKLIEGLKSPDTSSLLLPDLLSLSDPFGGSVEESSKGRHVFICVHIVERLKPKTKPILFFIFKKIIHDQLFAPSRWPNIFYK